MGKIIRTVLEPILWDENNPPTKAFYIFQQGLHSTQNGRHRSIIDRGRPETPPRSIVDGASGRTYDIGNRPGDYIFVDFHPDRDALIVDQIDDRDDQIATLPNRFGDHQTQLDISQGRNPSDQEVENSAAGEHLYWLAKAAVLMTGPGKRNNPVDQVHINNMVALIRPLYWHCYEKKADGHQLPSLTYVKLHDVAGASSGHLTARRDTVGGIQFHERFGFNMATDTENDMVRKLTSLDRSRIRTARQRCSGSLVQFEDDVGNGTKPPFRLSYETGVMQSIDVPAAHAIDPDDDRVIQYRIIGIPNGMVYNPATHQLDGIPVLSISPNAPASGEISNYYIIAGFDLDQEEVPAMGYIEGQQYTLPDNTPPS